MKGNHRARLNALFQATRQAFHEADQQTWRDLKALRHLPVKANSFLYLVCTGGLLALLLILATWNLGVPSLCRPDGKFSLDWFSFNYWATGFFEISLAFGSFSFAQVKALDVAFQLIVGRGGQAFLAFLSWKALSAHVTVKMTEAPVTYFTYWVIFLYKEPTPLSTYRLAREFYRHRHPGSIVAAAGILITIIFLLVFPTAVNSMTGYMTVNVPYIQSLEGNMIKATSFDQIAYIIHDGERIGKTDNYIVPFMFENPDSLTRSMASRLSVWSKCRSHHDDPGCDLLRAVSDYTEEYGFYAQSDRNKTTWNETLSLDPPLNISGTFFPERLNPWFYGREWSDPRTGDKPFQDNYRAQYVSGEEIYDPTYISRKGQCQPSLDELYSWGFAFVQLYLMVVALFVWSIYTHLTWHKARLRLPTAGEPQVPQGWRAVLELSRSMEAELSAEGIDIGNISDREARREIEKHLGGGRVSFKQYELPSRSLLSALRAWAHKERWWIGSFVLCVILVVGMVWVDIIIVAFMAWVALCVMMVVCVGTTAGSRLIMLAVLGLVGVLLAGFIYLAFP